VVGSLALLCAFSLTSSGAQASQLIQEQSFTEKKTNFNDTTTLVFDKFDDQGGTLKLQTVEVIYEQILRAEVQIPTPPNGAVITVKVGTAQEPASLSTAAPLGLSLDPLDPSKTAFVSLLQPIEVVWSFTEGGPFEQIWETSPTGLSVLYSDPLDVDQFLGSDQFTLASIGQSNASYSSSTGSGAAIIITSADVRARVVYTFQAVPEPSSLVLIGIGGILGIVVLGKRGARRRAASGTG
jgi:hypothetical protein